MDYIIIVSFVITCSLLSVLGFLLTPSKQKTEDTDLKKALLEYEQKIKQLEDKHESDTLKILEYELKIELFHSMKTILDAKKSEPSLIFNKESFDDLEEKLEAKNEPSFNFRDKKMIEM